MTLPVVTLIGQKNVGKSTLFNRLTNTCDALVANYSGLTRDRQYGYLQCNLFKSIIIDTGGIDGIYLSSSNMILQSHVINQAILAIEEANIVLFVVDGRFKETSVDCDIVDFLRKLNKSIFIVVNKIDGISDDHIAMVWWEYHVFGINNIIPISAIHGHGVNYLLEQIFCQIKKDMFYEKDNSTLLINKDTISAQVQSEQLYSQFTKTKSIVLAVVGRPNSGKSTFINNIVGSNRVIVCSVPGTTRNSVYISTIYNRQQYVLIDTAGIRKKNKINDIAEQISILKTFQVVRDAHIVLFMVDADIGVSDRDLSALKCIMEIGKSLIIIVNKWDNISLVIRNKVKAMLFKQMYFIEFVQIHFISALYGNGIKNLFQSIQETYFCIGNIRAVRSSKLTHIMRAAVVKNPPPLLLNKKRRIQPKYVHIGGHDPLRLIIHGSYVSKLPNDYQRYLKRFFYRALNIRGIVLHLQFKDACSLFVCKKSN